MVKIRDGQVTNRPAYTAVGVTADGTRDILGIWIGTGGEGAKFWLQVLTDVSPGGWPRQVLAGVRVRAAG